MDSENLRMFLVCFEIVGMFLLLYIGTFIKTKYYNYSRVMLVIVIAGVVVKITHWTFNDFFFIIGFLGVLLFYFLSFLKKDIKKRVDYLKLCWVTVAVFCTLPLSFHITQMQYLILTSILMFFIFFDYFVVTLLERKKT